MEESLKRPDDPLSLLQESFDLPSPDVRTYSPLVLAYIGDAVYEIIIRTIVVEQGNAPAAKLHRRTTRMVRAEAQAGMIRALKKDLTEEEKSIYKRGRNAKSFTKAKNASTADYRKATGFEALVGYLYLKKDFSRLNDLVRTGLRALEQKK